MSSPTRIVVPVLAALVLAGAAPVRAADAAPHAGGSSCSALTARSAELHRAQGAMDARLQQLVTQMNGATGERKVQAMSDVLSELVAQRRALLRMNDEAQRLAVQHAALHAAEGPAAIARCPYFANLAGSPGPAEPSGTGAPRGTPDDTAPRRATPASPGSKPPSATNQPGDDSGRKGARTAPDRGEGDGQKPR